MTSPYNLIVITGPTASGKTSVAAHLAARLGSEIISADSRQVYRSLNLGTGKDYDDYCIGGINIPYHLIDIVDAGYQYNVFEYQKDFVKVFDDITARQKMPILCGGTGMYIEAVLKGYQLVQVPINQSLRDQLEGKTLDELAQILTSYKTVHNKSDLDTTKRAIRSIEIADYQVNNPVQEVDFPKINPLVIGVRYDREIERGRITERLKARLNCGMIDEVKTLLRNGVTAQELIYYGLEYKFLTQYVIGEISYDEMFSGLNTAIHQFAKRQMTWFRRMEKQVTEIHWLEGSAPIAEKIDKIMTLLYPNS